MRPRSQISAVSNGAAVESVGLGAIKTLALALLTVAALMKLAEQSYSPFLYFQF